jgi:hypothetical protein
VLTNGRDRPAPRFRREISRDGAARVFDLHFLVGGYTRALMPSRTMPPAASGAGPAVWTVLVREPGPRPDLPTPGRSPRADMPAGRYRNARVQSVAG